MAKGPIYDTNDQSNIHFLSRLYKAGEFNDSASIGLSENQRSRAAQKQKYTSRDLKRFREFYGIFHEFLSRYRQSKQGVVDGVCVVRFAHTH